jgi:hypothetical protein
MSTATTETASAPRRKVLPHTPKGGTAKTAAKAAPAKAKAAPTATDGKSAGPKRYVGKTSGLRVQEFQTKSLADNFKAKLTDEQIAKTWREEFPLAVKFSDKTVKAVRVRFNKGIHGGQEGTPARLSRPYDAEGKELALRGEGGNGSASARAEAAPTSAPVAKKKVTVKRKS